MRAVIKRPCFVYMIIADDGTAAQYKNADELFKVGISDNPWGRLEVFKTASPFPLSMPFKWRLPSRDGAYYIERWFHENHSRQRLNGEWFRAHIAASACELASLLVYYHWRAVLGHNDEEGAEYEEQSDIRDLLEFLRFTGMEDEAARDLVQSEFGDVV